MVILYFFYSEFQVLAGVALSARFDSIVDTSYAAAILTAVLR